MKANGVGHGEFLNTRERKAQIQYRNTSFLCCTASYRDLLVWSPLLKLKASPVGNVGDYIDIRRSISIIFKQPHNI